MDKTVKFLLALVISLSIFLNFYKLFEGKMFAYDEGEYFNVVKSARSVIDYGAEKIRRSGKKADKSSFIEYFRKKGGSYYIAAKPTYLAISFLFSLFAGLKDYTLPLTNAVLGVLTVILILLITAKLKDIFTGIIAAAVLSVSWFHLSYSRSAFPHTTAIFFSYLTFYLYLLCREKEKAGFPLNKFVFLYAFSLGLSFSSHYFVFWLVSLFSFIEIVFFFKNFRKSPSLSSKRILIWGIGIFIPLAFWQIATWTAKIFIYSIPSFLSFSRNNPVEDNFITYFSQLFKQFFSVNRQTGYQGNIFSFSSLIIRKEGYLFLFSFLSGAILILRDYFKNRGEKEKILAVLYFFIPFLIFSSYSHYPTARTFSIAIPAAAIIIAYFLRSLSLRYKYAAVFLFMMVIAGQISNSIPILFYKSGFKEAVNYMKTHKGAEHLSSNPLISRAYVDRDEALDMSFSFRDKEIDPTGKLHIDPAKLKKFHEEKHWHYLLLDQFRYSNPNEIYLASSKLKPVFTAEHTTTAFFYDSRKEYQDQILKHKPIIEIYDLEEIVKKVEEDAKKNDKKK